MSLLPAAVFGLLAAAPVGAPPARPFPVWPIPRESRYEEGRLLLTDAVVVVPEGDARAQWPGRFLAELVADHFGVALPVVTGRAPEGKTPIVVGLADAALVADAAKRAGASVPGAAEGYLVSVGASEAVVAGRDARGALYGAWALAELVHEWGKRSVAARRALVRDWPYLPVRWVHLYLPGRDQLDFARRYMRDVLLRFRFNGLVLETGGGMRLDSHPELSVGWKRTVAEWYAHGETMDNLGEGIPLGTARRFAASLHVGVGGGGYVEKDDVRRLAAWAELYGLEIVPEVQSLSHAYYIASTRRDVAEDPDMAWPDSYCPSNPESYRILFDVLDEYIGVLRPKRVHIGHDEWRAGAFCPRCRGKDEGALFAEDVLRIHRHLEQKGIETWLWGDHFVDSHNRFAKKWTEGGVVRYEKPDTASARERIAAATKAIHVLNWSGEEGDRTFQRLGWPFVVGNFAGSEEKDWRGRVARAGALGGEVSSWGAFAEFTLGRLQIPEAVMSANLLWSVHDPDREDALAEVGERLASVRARLGDSPPSLAADPMRFEVLDLASAWNSPPRGDGFDLSGLVPGRHYVEALPYAVADPRVRGGRSVVTVARREADGATRAELPVHGRWASLVFVQSATGAGREPIHAGDQTHFPRESAELIGFYEIRYRDGLVGSHAIRYAETVGRWDAGPALPFYFARPLVAGKLPDGRNAVVWGSEWTNPRPDVEIASVALVGSPGPTNARPILLGVTAVAKPRVEDLR